MAFRYWFGGVLVVAGLGLLADQFIPGLGLGLWIARLWPLAVIALGVLVLLTRTSTLLGGIILLIIGAILQFSVLGWLSDNVWGLLWPSFLILLGLLVVFRLGRPSLLVGEQNDVINSFGVFSGYGQRPQSQNFRGGSATAVFGGMRIDLTDSKPAKEGAVLELTAAFGGMTVFVPRDWKVEMTGLPLFGGWSNKTVAPSTENAPNLTIRCLVMFGGIEVKN
jgi:hypothetical protein